MRTVLEDHTKTEKLVQVLGYTTVAGTEKQLLEGTVETIHIPFVDNIYYDPRFIRLYSLAIVTSSENGIRTFVRRDLIGALLEQGFEVLEIDY